MPGGPHALAPPPLPENIFEGSFKVTFRFLRANGTIIRNHLNVLSQETNLVHVEMVSISLAHANSRHVGFLARGARGTSLVPRPGTEVIVLGSAPWNWLARPKP